MRQGLLSQDVAAAKNDPALYEILALVELVDSVVRLLQPIFDELVLTGAA